MTPPCSSTPTTRTAPKPSATAAATASSNPFTFKAGIDDIATGLVKFGQRWYNPYIGAWTQQDTLDSPLDPSNGNRYAYAASDPINQQDPTGRVCSPSRYLEYAVLYGGGAAAVTAVVALPSGPLEGIAVPVGATIGAIAGVLYATDVNCNDL
ncbi:RHS repeat-associated core domain-containing protein [Sphingomonas sp. LR61]|uniref:RHS repeat-associated core domain-containing protein n=1 Tax=Sphingomonas sp. LR61 TaxID=3050234 RepID=UPI003FA78913